tara:strand:+ start:108105 stop:111206 length:3102 start_codon:yes stop_codon:yes gene_type:complete
VSIGNIQLQPVDKLNRVLIVTQQSLPEALLLMLDNLFIQVEIVDSLVADVMTQSQVDEHQFVFVDVSMLDEKQDKAQVVATTINPVVFIHFEQQIIGLQLALEFCCIHWPCSAQEIKNQLALSQYKNTLRKQYQQQNELLHRTFTCVGDILIYLDANGDTLDLNQKAEQLFALDRDEYKAKPWYHLLRIQRQIAAKQTQHFIAAAIKSKAVTKIQPLAVQLSAISNLLLDGIIGPIDYPDGTTGAVLVLRKLADMEKIPTILSKYDARHPSHHNTSNILLISPDNFRQINQQYDWQVGNTVLDEIEARIAKVLRASDLSVRYSGVSFLVLLYDTESAQTHNLLNKIMNTLVREVYLSQKISLTFSFGLALNNESLEYSPIELFYSANFALSQAKELGGNQCREWQQQNTLQQIGNFDRVNGSFLGKGTSDYQNMLKFWITLNKAEHIQNKALFIDNFLSALIKEFGLDSGAFFDYQDGKVALFQGLDSFLKPLNHEQLSFSSHQHNAVQQMARSEEAVDVFTTMKALQGMAVLVPVKIKSQLRGVILISSNDEHSALLRDHHLLTKIANFVAVNLKHEVKSVSPITPITVGNSTAEFWYTSEQMQKVMQEVSLVAPTDATVLITGESGTGKEMIAKGIHQHSNRKTKPFVIFDCGTAVESLLESELFGHVRGAFTGADKTSIGCIQKAQGGTLFLDEIGELPINVQVKLLRFVQEKQFSAVGSSSYKSADVRVVAATNVDLEQQIKKGLFREDLYYRLNVFQIHSPPLRERDADILLLAERYLHKYSAEYGKDINSLTVLAKQAITEYHWPGNVRELKNLMHRAAIICTESQLDCIHLGLYPETTIEDIAKPLDVPSATLASSLKEEQQIKSLQQGKLASPKESHSAKTIQPHSLCMDIITQTRALDTGEAKDVGKLILTLEKQLYQICLENSQNISLQAAGKLNIAESTFRRRWKKLQVYQYNLPDALFDKINQLANDILALQGEESKVTLMQKCMLHSILMLGLTSQEGARLMDMSAPTFRNMAKKSPPVQ